MTQHAFLTNQVPLSFFARGANHTSSKGISPISDTKGESNKRGAARATPVASERRYRRSENVNGEFYVDSSCIDCATCRWVCPSVFNRQNGMSAVHSQPKSESEEMRALQAAVACPTGSIRTTTPNQGAKHASTSFPTPALDQDGNPVHGVYYLGYTSRYTFGASSWLLLTQDAAIMMDCPRFSNPLAKGIDNLISSISPTAARYIVLSHRDDVHGHDKWAARLNARRVIHHTECNTRQRTTECEVQLADHDFPYTLSKHATVIHVPGHTRGSIALLDHGSSSLFSGDHTMMTPSGGELTASTTYCFYSWAEQIRSIAKLVNYPILHIWPGHGWPMNFTDDTHKRNAIEQAVKRLSRVTA